MPQICPAAPPSPPAPAGRKKKKDRTPEAVNPTPRTRAAQITVRKATQRKARHVAARLGLAPCIVSVYAPRCPSARARGMRRYEIWRGGKRRRGRKRQAGTGARRGLGLGADCMYSSFLLLMCASLISLRRRKRTGSYPGESDASPPPPTLSCPSPTRDFHVLHDEHVDDEQSILARELNR